MGLCYVCGKETDLPYKCTYCGLTFCGDHRLPEQHNCIMLPRRNWEIFRELKNVRECYGWIGNKTKKKVPTSSSESSRLNREFDRIPKPINDEFSKNTQDHKDMKCMECGSVNSLYPCIYCNHLFCEKHILPENHDCSNYFNKTNAVLSFPKISNPFTSIMNNLRKSKFNAVMESLMKLSFLLIISLPVLDSIQLLWDSPLTFSRTILPKWWEIFPSEYPIPSINLLYLYFGLLILYIYSLWIFLSKMGYGKYDPKRVRFRNYYYVLIIGIFFLFFFSEASMFWVTSIIKIIFSILGRVQR